MSAITFEVTLILKGPVLTKSTTKGGYGVDAPMYKNAAGSYALPATLVKGCLRQSLEEISSVNAAWVNSQHIQALLGQESGSYRNSDANVAPQSAQLRFEDFANSDGRPVNAPRYRIAIEEQTGSVKHGFLQVLEAPWGSGSSVRFTGRIVFIPSKEVDAGLAEKYLRMGLGFITGAGAERTIGFGRLEDFELSRAAPPAAPAPTLRASGDSLRLPLSLSFHSPFCIAKHRADENLFESEEVVPGGVIKGAVAAAWCRLLGRDAAAEVTPDLDPKRRELAAAFPKVRFSHAFPSETSARPVQPPLSLVRAKALGDHHKDVLLIPHDGLILKTKDSEGGDTWEAPRFQIDWKHELGDTRQRLGWPTLQRRLAIRTKLDRQHGRAEDEMLFGTETIVPGKCRWLFSIEILAVEAGTAAVRDQLLGLLPLLDIRIGKTKSAASLETVSIDPPSSKPINGHYAIALQTPALLSEPGVEDMKRTYEDYWHRHSGGALQLTRFFASQKLAGGYYLHNRFVRSNTYKPWLLTNEGSVFLLKICNQTAAEKLVSRWKSIGLPPNDKLGSLSWKSCPHLPENGYGEIAVNLSLHQDDRLTEDAYEAV